MIVIIQGIFGQPLEHYFTWPLTCSWGALLFCHSFLIVPEIPVPLLGWNLLSQLKAQILPQAAISASPSFRNKKKKTRTTKVAPAPIINLKFLWMLF
jgi:hypothetical protein